MSRLTDKDWKNPESLMWTKLGLIPMRNEVYRASLGEALRKLAHYEDLEDEGRLIELPCAVGDTVYTIGRHCPRPWKKEYCDDARKILQEDSCGVCPHRTAYIATHEFDFDDLTYESEMFTTKEEAEAKLAEMEGAE